MAQVPNGMQTTKLAIIDDFIVNMRLRTIYRMLKDEQYVRVNNMIINLIDILRKTPEVKMEKDRYNMVLTSLMRMKIHVSLKRYSEVHNLLRDVQIYDLVKYKVPAKEYKLYF